MWDESRLDRSLRKKRGVALLSIATSGHFEFRLGQSRPLHPGDSATTVYFDPVLTVPRLVPRHRPVIRDWSWLAQHLCMHHEECMMHRRGCSHFCKNTTGRHQQGY